MIGGFLSGAANLLDLPGSMVRDALALRNPLDQVMTPFSDTNRTSGRGLLRRYGMAGDKDTWGNYLGGMAAETLLDPTNLVGAGLVGKSLKRASALRQIGRSTTPGFTPGQVGALTGYAPQAWSDDAMQVGDDAWKSAMSPGEMDAVTQWKSMGGSNVPAMNEIARSGDFGQHAPLIENLDSAIAGNATSRPLQNYRSIRPTPGVSDLQPGGTFTDPGYFATSKFNSPELSFYGRALPGNDTTLMDVVLPPGTPAADMSNSLNQFRESELLLPRNQQFDVLARKDVPTLSAQKHYTSSMTGKRETGSPQHYLRDQDGMPVRGPSSNEDPAGIAWALDHQRNSMGRNMDEATAALADDYTLSQSSIPNLLMERLDPNESPLRRYMRRPQPLKRTALPLLSYNLSRLGED